MGVSVLRQPEKLAVVPDLSGVLEPPIYVDTGVGMQMDTSSCYKHKVLKSTRGFYPYLLWREIALHEIKNCLDSCTQIVL